MRFKLTLWIFCSALLTTVAKAATPEELFQIAKDFYSREAGSTSWPETKPKGSSALKEAAKSDYLPALYALYLGFEYGYIGVRDPIQSREYFDRWAATSRNSELLYRAGLMHLGVLKPVPPPKPGDTNFIFTGDFSKRSRENVLREFKGITGSIPSRDDKSALRDFLLCIERQLNDRSSTNISERVFAEKALEILTDSAVGAKFPIKSDDAYQAPLTPLEFGQRKAEVFDILVRSRMAGFIPQSNGGMALLNLTKSMDEGEFRRIFVLMENSSK